MTKIVVNKCFGGFSISLTAARRMAELGHPKAQEEVAEYDEKLADPSKLGEFERGGPRWYGYFVDRNEARADPVLVRVVEELGDEADGSCASFEVVEIPDDVDWQIEEYDGLEHIAEKHRTW